MPFHAGEVLHVFEHQFLEESQILNMFHLRFKCSSLKLNVQAKVAFIDCWGKEK